MSIVSRGDYSTYLYHLTTEAKLNNILSSGKILGNICPERLYKANNCISFSESPLPFIIDQLYDNRDSHRYDLYGVGVKKSDVFRLGGRHAIYQPISDYAELPENMKYRHVTHDLSAITKTDWTWKREWIINIEEIILTELEDPLILVKKIDDMNNILTKFYDEYNSSNQYAVLVNPLYFDYAKPFPFTILPLEIFHP